MHRRPHHGSRPGLIQGHSLERFMARRFDPDTQPNPLTLREMAEESYRSGRLLNRFEAMRRIGGPIRLRQDRFYRSDGTGPGVWIGRWRAGTRECVMTYLGPRKLRTWPHPCRIPLSRRRACA